MSSLAYRKLMGKRQDKAVRNKMKQEPFIIELIQFHCRKDIPELARSTNDSTHQIAALRPRLPPFARSIGTKKAGSEQALSGLKGNDERTSQSANVPR